jgi:two-component system response regulator BaeR
MAQILLIESDKIIASNVMRVLSRAGHAVDWQVDPQRAVDSAEAKLPDVIILDMVLAGRAGVEFLYEFRSYPDWQSTPVVVFSSLSADELQTTQSGLEHLDIFAYHHKPNTSLAELVRTVEQLLQPVPA